jgi:hypothetical protein
MATDAAIQAALNNALWCDTICRAHRLPTSFWADAWVTRSPAPPLYPNLVTLSPEDVDSQMGRVTELRSSLGNRGWAVKDSFNNLDLVAEGFQPMFDAVWVHRAAPPGGLCDLIPHW